MPPPGAIPTAEAVDDLLPQTQCNRCTYGGCLPYARAMLAEQAPINRCPPGGTATIAALASLLGRPVVDPDPDFGTIGPLRLALIDEALCIGCTLCIQACPVDAILGAVKRMHTVLPALCTGCELCIPPCPMDCIALVPPAPAREWTRADALAARTRLQAREERLARLREEDGVALAGKALRKLDELDARDDLDWSEIARRKSIVARAIERARARLGGGA
jgi:electron transport complex protein RnfB